MKVDPPKKLPNQIQFRAISQSEVVAGFSTWMGKWITNTNYYSQKERLGDFYKLKPLLSMPKDIEVSKEVRKLICERLLLCISQDPLLSKSLVLVGGAALRYFYDSQRETYDLDFTWKQMPDKATKMLVLKKLESLWDKNIWIFEKEIEPKIKFPAKVVIDEGEIIEYLIDGQIESSSPPDISKKMSQKISQEPKMAVHFLVEQEFDFDEVEEEYKEMKNEVILPKDKNSWIKIECNGAECIFEPKHMLTPLRSVLVQDIRDIYYSKLLAAVSRKSLKDSDLKDLIYIQEKYDIKYDRESLKKKAEKRYGQNKNETSADLNDALSQEQIELVEKALIRDI